MVKNSTNIYEDIAVEEIKEIIEDLNRKNLNHETFLLNITHDLRGHLNVIISALQYMQRSNHEMSKEDERYLSMIKRNSYKMLRLINNLIDTNKLENNFYKLNRRNIDIVPMIECTIGSIDKYASEKEINMIFDTNEEECVTSVDPEAVDRIIMNLLSNAIKFSPNESNIFISLEISEDEIKILIKDEGMGISEEEQEKIFDRFYQSMSRTNKEVIGSGIGLDLSNYLVKAHGGYISLNSKLGEGSEFIVTLPRQLESNGIEIENEYSSKIQMLEMEFSDIYLS